LDFEAQVQALGAAPGALSADYFDGQRPVRQPVRVQVQGEHLVGQGERGELFRVRRAEVRWPQRHQHGQRSAHLPGDAVLHARDAQAWDDWVHAHGLYRDRVGHWQAHWGAWLGSAAVLVLCAVFLLRWGLPWGAEVIARALPERVAQSIGQNTLAQLQADWLTPTALDEATQQDWRQRFERAQAQWQAAADLPAVSYRLHFAGGGALGANALALPSGDVVITDELLRALDGHDVVVLGVLAHELTHVRERHVMRQMVQASLLGVLISALTGDFSAVVTAAATFVGASHYSREFEREADDGAVAFLRANGWSPAEMTVLFQRLRDLRGAQNTASAWGIALASHPSDAERVQRFRDAAQAPALGASGGR
jgi:Zn-dependent protease with chaperone function